MSDLALPPQGAIPGVQTSASPAVVTYQGSLYLFYRDASDNLIRYTTFGDAGTWSTPTALPANVNTSDAPLAFDLGNLFVVYKGVPGDSRIYRVATSDGATWFGEVLDTSADAGCTTSIGTDLPPGAGTFSGQFYVLFRSSIDSSTIYQTQSADLDTWTCPVELPYTTSAAPGVISWGNGLSLFFKGANDNRIYQATLTADGWSPPDVLPDNFQTSDTPCPMMFSDLTILFYKGVPGDNRIWMASFLFESWRITELDPGINTSAGPQAVLFNSSPYLFYKGESADPAVYVVPMSDVLPSSS